MTSGPAEPVRRAVPATGVRADPAGLIERLRARETAAVAELHALLGKAAAFETRRRGAVLGIKNRGLLEDLAQQATADAVVLVLDRLDVFEGRSRFTTWAWKFAIHTAGVAVRREAWRGREVPMDASALDAVRDQLAEPAAATAERREFIDELVQAMGRLSPRQREVLVAVVVDGVPIDVLAERRGTSRGALYKVLHDARRALRRDLAGAGVLGEGV